MAQSGLVGNPPKIFPPPWPILCLMDAKTTNGWQTLLLISIAGISNWYRITKGQNRIHYTFFQTDITSLLLGRNYSDRQGGIPSSDQHIMGKWVLLVSILAGTAVLLIWKNRKLILNRASYGVNCYVPGQNVSWNLPINPSPWFLCR